MRHLFHTALAAMFLFVPAVAAQQAGVGGDGLPAVPVEAEAEDIETALWLMATELDTPLAYRAYLDRFPDGRFASLARALIDRQENGAAPDQADVQADDAAPRPETAADRDVALWQETREADTVRAYRRYLTRFPGGQFADAAEARLARLEAERRDRQAWVRAAERNTAAQYRAYLAEFPDGAQVERARNRLRNLDRQAWSAAREAGTVAAFNSYLRDFPDGGFADRARRQLQQRRDAEAWTSARRTNTPAAYRNYLSAFPDGRQVEAARTRLRRLEDNAAWAAARRANTVASYRSYLSQFPDGARVQVAQRRIQNLQTPPPRPARVSVPQRQENALRLTRNDRARIQRHLATRGFRTGPIDGIFGRQSRAAIRAYQRSRSLRVTGFVDRATFQRMRREGLPVRR